MGTLKVKTENGFEKIGGGGGGTGGVDAAKVQQIVDAYLAGKVAALPVVTPEDNGKILQVADGTWAAVEMLDVSEVGL